MLHKLLNWLRNAYRKITTSIAFLPAIIALSLLGVCYLMIRFDFSDAGKNLKSNLNWLSLKDASTARSICTAIASGVISLTVFSFSMVMILLSQAASQMSNRILGKLISNTFQQVVLGFYIGTIIYSLSLLSTIRDIDTGIHVPAMSTYLLIGLTVTDIFLFIYFLHYITQSVKYETIIHSIFIDTHAALKKNCKLKVSPSLIQRFSEGTKICINKSGVYQGFQINRLVTLCKEEDVALTFLYPIGVYLIKGTPLLVVNENKNIPKDFGEKVSRLINMGRGNDINTSYFFGLRQLTEIAIKALSPGINDPGTAVIALHALGDLLAYRSTHFPENYLYDENGLLRIVTKEQTLEEIFENYILPIWDYGQKDRLLNKEMVHILTLLQQTSERWEVDKLINVILISKMQSDL